MPSEQPATRVEKCPTCGSDDPTKVHHGPPKGSGLLGFHISEWTPFDCPDSFHDPAPPSEQPREGTRVKVVFTRAEAEALLLASDGYFSPDATNLGLGANKIAAALEPAQPQPREEEARVGGRIQEGALSAVRTPTNPPVESRLVPLAPPRGEGDDLAKLRQELLLRASTHPEQSERIVGAALDLLDSLGAPHYHDLIGMTYTLRKEQADNLRAALVQLQQGEAITRARALALIDQWEKALEAADELADSITDEVLSGASWTGVLKAAIAYRSARSTSTKEDG